MIWRGEGDHIDVLVLEQFSNVGITLDFLARALAARNASFEDFAIDIAQGNQSHALEATQVLDMTLAASVKPNDGAANVTVRAADAHRSGRLGGYSFAIFRGERWKQAERGSGDDGGF